MCVYKHTWNITRYIDFLFQDGIVPECDTNWASLFIPCNCIPCKSHVMMLRQFKQFLWRSWDNIYSQVKNQEKNEGDEGIRRKTHNLKYQKENDWDCDDVDVNVWWQLFSWRMLYVHDRHHYSSTWSYFLSGSFFPKEVSREKRNTFVWGREQR